jgi:hypothetical protein
MPRLSAFSEGPSARPAELPRRTSNRTSAAMRNGLRPRAMTAWVGTDRGRNDCGDPVPVRRMILVIIPHDALLH